MKSKHEQSGLARRVGPNVVSLAGNCHRGTRAQWTKRQRAAKGAPDITRALTFVLGKTKLAGSEREPGRKKRDVARAESDFPTSIFERE